MRVLSRLSFPSVLTVLLSSSLLLFQACGGGDEEKEDDKGEFDEEMSQADSAKDSRVMNVEGKLFSIPSPIQTAYLVEKSGAEFKESLLNSPDNAAKYATKVEKAVNLGIYGADLGYVTIYDNTQNSLDYLSSIRTLADDIGVGSAFDEDLIERFSNNLENEDSLLVIVSDAYKVGDAYLKKNERSDVAGLILAGGWIESVYFASHVAMKGDESVKERVAMQKTSLNNLIQLLARDRNQEEVNDLVEDLETLYGIFKDVSIEYEYKEPETKPDEKLTILKSETKVELSDEQLEQIHEQIKELRNQITDR